MSNNIPIIVDLGTSEIKAGFSGQEKPELCF
jgi:actin-related protein